MAGGASRGAVAALVRPTYMGKKGPACVISELFRSGIVGHKRKENRHHRHRWNGGLFGPRKVV